MEKESLVVFELHHLGDALLALPFLRAARQIYALTVVCPPASGEILRLAGLDEREILPWEPPWHVEKGKYSAARWRGAAVADLLRALKARSPRVAATAWADARVHWLMRLSGARERYGFPMNRRNYYAWQAPGRSKQLVFGRILTAAGWLSGGPLLTHSLQRHAENQPHWQTWGQLAESMGFAQDTSLPWLPPPPETLLPDGLRDFLAHSRNQKRPVWIVHPGARKPIRRWPAERWPALIRQALLAQGASVVLVDPPDSPAVDMPDAEWTRHYAPPSLLELGAILASGAAVLCMDSFSGHFAAVLGRPVVTIFGPTNPDWYSPFGQRENLVIVDICPHRPCLDHCVMPTPICILSVEVPLVAARVSALQRTLAGES